MAQKKSIIGYNNLCEELQAEILLRLPTAAAAVRFKVVCKRWYSLISSPYFIARFIHLRHHRHVNSSLVFQIRYYIDLTSHSGDCRKFHSEFKTISNSSLLCDCDVRLDYLPTDLRLEGSFDDLILCSCITYTRPYIQQIIYYVINPLTRQWIALPPPPSRERLTEIGFLCVPPPCSECKPLDTSHHKVVVVMLDSPTPRSTFKVHVFSSEDGQWRTLVVSSPLPLTSSVLVTSSLVAYRGMLHWLNEDCRVVYDPLNTPKTFSRIIHLPMQLAFCSNFCVCQGHLCVGSIEIGGGSVGPVVDVWELEDYDSGLWKLVHKVYLNNLIYDDSLPTGNSLYSNFLVASLHLKNGDFVYMEIDNGIALVNLKTRRVESYSPAKKMQ